MEEKDERALVISKLVLGDSNEKDEEYEPSMEEDMNYKEWNNIS